MKKGKGASVTRFGSLAAPGFHHFGILLTFFVARVIHFNNKSPPKLAKNATNGTACFFPNGTVNRSRDATNGIACFFPKGTVNRSRD